MQLDRGDMLRACQDQAGNGATQKMKPMKRLNSALICINLYDGIRRISSSKYHTSLIIALVLTYLFISIPVIEMAWDFRDMCNSVAL